MQDTSNDSTVTSNRKATESKLQTLHLGREVSMQTPFKILASLRPFVVAMMLFVLLFRNSHADIVLAQEGPPLDDGGYSEPPT